ncbi:MAG: NAD kinase [Elusimicrobia bacterium]|nr:NAD kinase [Elusimicrobiota bacterium]
MSIHPRSHFPSKIQSVTVVCNPEKQRARSELSRLQEWFRRNKIVVNPIQRLNQSDALVTLGGDGTILSVAAKAAQAGVPVLGINIGRLGFMTSIELGALYPSLKRWVSGKWDISERLMLEVSAPRVKESLFALNEAVVRCGSTTRVITVDASIENENLGRFTGDGVIVATPTGSTAYSLAAQGPVVHPEVEALVLTPVCAHSFTQRPVVYPKHQKLILSLQDQRVGNEVQLCLDGQRVYALKSGDKVGIQCALHKLKLFQEPGVSYFSVLREKLSWGER